MSSHFFCIVVSAEKPYETDIYPGLTLNISNICLVNGSKQPTKFYAEVTSENDDSDEEDGGEQHNAPKVVIGVLTEKNSTAKIDVTFFPEELIKLTVEGGGEIHVSGQFVENESEDEGEDEDHDHEHHDFDSDSNDDEEIDDMDVPENLFGKKPVFPNSDGRIEEIVEEDKKN